MNDLLREGERDLEEHCQENWLGRFWYGGSSVPQPA